MTQTRHKLTKRDRRIARAKIKKPPQVGLEDSLKEFFPKTKAQEKIFNDFSSYHMVLSGVPGSGKSFLAIYLSLKEILSGNSQYNKIMIIRSVVPTRDMGFLPGNAKEKAAQYELPYHQIFAELFGRGDAYELCKSKGIVEFTTTSFVRGNTFDRAIVIFDEYQNTTDHELHSVITRLGDKSKLVLCGDNNQNDLKNEKNGYYKFMQIAKRMKAFSMIEFNVDDVVRSKFVKEYLIQRHFYEMNNENEKF